MTMSIQYSDTVFLIYHKGSGHLVHVASSREDAIDYIEFESKAVACPPPMEVMISFYDVVEYQIVGDSAGKSKTRL